MLTSQLLIAFEKEQDKLSNVILSNLNNQLNGMCKTKIKIEFTGPEVMNMSNALQILKSYGGQANHKHTDKFAEVTMPNTIKIICRLKYDNFLHRTRNRNCTFSLENNLWREEENIYEIIVLSMYRTFCLPLKNSYMLTASTYGNKGKNGKNVTMTGDFVFYHNYTPFLRIKVPADLNLINTFITDKGENLPGVWDWLQEQNQEISYHHEAIK